MYILLQRQGFVYVLTKLFYFCLVDLLCYSLLKKANAE
jgi:hypothetical protein